MTSHELKLQQSTQDLPSNACRKRKVRCSKTEPCSNCKRLGQECTFDDSSRLVRRRRPGADVPAAEKLRKRVSELEGLVQSLQRPSSQGGNLTSIGASVRR